MGPCPSEGGVAQCIDRWVNRRARPQTGNEESQPDRRVKLTPSGNAEVMVYFLLGFFALAKSVFNLHVAEEEGQGLHDFKGCMISRAA